MVLRRPKEYWRDIPGWEGLYKVSSLGRVMGFVHGPRLMKRSSHSSGHLVIRLHRGGKGKTYTVHRLVMMAFVGPLPAGLETRHLNGDGTDCRLVNLRYGTRSENIMDRVRHGTHHQANKTHCPQGHEYTYSNVYEWHGRRMCRKCLRLLPREVGNVDG